MGKLKVISGMRLPRSALDVSAGLPPLATSSLPQTKQRVASLLRRVPQVGQSFVEVTEFSVVIGKLSLKVICWPPNSGDDYTSLCFALRIDLK